MFSIIISEKGGAERRDSFDKNEINVGRVQGNDLMLPKGNVSKHHARLLFRDGRFIVTDLKSTNGTYVNGRKIAQATIVREGDKIYIGDFVLRLETNGASIPVPEAPAGEEESIRTLAREGVRPAGAAPNPPAVTLKAPTHPPGAPLPRPQPQNVSSAPVGQSTPSRPADATPLPPAAAAPPTPQGFPLEHDPDDSGPAQKPAQRIPSGGIQAPLHPSGARPLTMPLNQMSPPIIGQRGPSAPGLQQPSTAQVMPVPGPQGPTAAPQTREPPLAVPTPVAAPRPEPPAPAPPPVAMPAPPPVVAPVPLAPPVVAAPPAPQMVPAVAAAIAAHRSSVAPPAVAARREASKDPPALAARRLAMTMLMGRIADAVDLSPLRASPHVPDPLAQQIERAAREQAKAMGDEGEAPQDVDLEGLVRDAHRELVGLGSFGPLLEDEEVSEIHCVRFDQVFTVRSGKVANEGVAFSSEEALFRVIARLAQLSGEAWRPGESVLERRLPRASLVAISPPAAANHVVSIRKRRRIESTLDELTRAGSLSRPMAQFLEACVAAHANILVSGALSAPVLAALAASKAGGERVCIVQDVEELSVANAHTVTLSIADTRKLGEECVRAAAKLRPDRLVVTQLAGGVAAATVDAMAEGSDGILAAIPAPTLRQGLSRLVAQLVLHRPGLSLEGMRDVVGEAFDIAIEVGALADGRSRIMRIAELGGSDAKGIVARDVFVFNAEASGDGSFSATGVVPRIANDLAARGVKLEPSMFKRAGR